MKMNTVTRRFGAVSPKKQKGMTLIELMIVVAIIAIIMIILVRAASGGTSGTRATALERIAKASAENITVLSEACGVPTQVASNPLLGSGKTMADVIFGGVTNVAPPYQDCYNSAGVRPLRDAVVKNGTGWQVQSFPLTLSGGGTEKLTVAYAAVPDEVTLHMVKAHDAGVTALAASNTTGDVIRYTTAVAGTRTVSILLD